MHQTEGQRERHWNGYCHQQGGAPLPKPHKGNHHDEDHRLPQTSVEQVDLLANLAALVGGAPNHQIGGKSFARLANSFVDRSAEPIDLVVLFHFNGERDGASSLPMAATPVRVIRKEPRRMLIAAASDPKISEIKQRSVAGLSDDRSADVIENSKLIGLFQLQISFPCTECAGGDRGV